MKKAGNVTFSSIAIFLGILIIPRPVYAYIGPGTISLLLQILAGLLVGGIAVIAMYWDRVKVLFSKKGKK